MRFLVSILVLIPLALIAADPEHDPGDGGPALQAFLNFPENVALDSRGNLYITERGGNRIRRVDARTGIITTIAGTGEEGYGGDGGPATQARLTAPTSIVIDRGGNVVFGDTFNYRIRRIDARTGIINTIAGTGEIGFSGDGGPATRAQISAPFGIVLDVNENLYFTDTENNRVRRIDAGTGIITTIAGNGIWAFEGDGGPATAASLARPHPLTLDRDGNVIVADTFNGRIRKIDLRSGIVSTIAGIGLRGSSGDGGPASRATFCYFGDLVFDRAGDLLVSGICDQRLRKIEMRTGIIRPFAGTGRPEFNGDGRPALQTSFYTAAGMAMDRRGNLFVADMRNHRIRRIDARTGIVATVAGGKEPRYPVITWRFVYNREEVARDVATPIRHTVPGMDAVSVREDIRYAGEDPLRRLDLYSPAARGKHPVVILVSGKNDLEFVPDQWAMFASRARILAASGFAAIMFNHRLGLNGSVPQAAEDLALLLDFLRRNAEEFRLDVDRTSILVYGLSAAAVTRVLRENPSAFRSVVAVHPFLDLRELYAWQAPGKTEENEASYSLAAAIAEGVAVPPMLVIRAGKDAEGINQGIDLFVAEAMKRNAEVELVNVPAAQPGFERDAPAITRRIVAFLLEHSP